MKTYEYFLARVQAREAGKQSARAGGTIAEDDDLHWGDWFSFRFMTTEKLQTEMIVISGTFAAHARGEETCYATIRDNAKYGNELIAFHDSPPPPQPGVSVVRAWVKYANNGLIRIWRILPNVLMSDAPSGSSGSVSRGS
jgi:hypothetical protein